MSVISAAQIHNVMVIRLACSPLFADWLKRNERVPLLAAPAQINVLQGDLYIYYKLRETMSKIDLPADYDRSLFDT